MSTTEDYVLNMGPQHPSTHGVLRVKVRLDGEKILSAIPYMGYLHRGIEKLLESRTYVQGVPYTDRLDYVSAMGNNLAYCRAVEKLAGIEVPQRADFIRVIVSELNRIASHFIFVGTLAIDLGASTGMIYGFKHREKVLDLFNMICGARMTYHYIRIGGVVRDIMPEFIAGTYSFLAEIPAIIDEFDKLLLGNEIFQHRLKNISVMTAEDALRLGVSGPSLRASGVDYDLRRRDYALYDQFSFEVPLGTQGDNWDRCMVRVREITESAKIIRQALDMLPEGDIMAKVPKVLKPPAGDVYSAIESPRGELGFYLVSDGSTKPYRVHVRRPSFINLQTLNHLSAGNMIGDIVAVLSTIDPIMGEVDC